MSEVTKIIAQLRKKVEEYFGEDATGHSIDHLERTLNYALHLQAKEGGDIVVIAISAFIHDIHRILGTKEKRFVSPKESLPVVETFLDNLNITKKQREHILFAIEHHEEYSFGKDGINVEDIESKILQDADNLDAIGAIGIARTFKYGAIHNMKDYEPSIPLYQSEYQEGDLEASTLHHIHNKLIRLGKHMNTDTAKELASKRTEFMEQFMNLYIDEVSGNL